MVHYWNKLIQLTCFLISTIIQRLREELARAFIIASQIAHPKMVDVSRLYKNINT